jgi:hypothetical protein
MGGCVDRGNSCIDGGFNDLLTVVSFDAIPTDSLFRSSIKASVQLLAETVVAMAAASNGIPPTAEQDSIGVAAEYVKARIGDHILEQARSGYVVDDRLRKFFLPPSANDLLEVVRKAHQRRAKSSQYVGAAQISQIVAERAALKAAVGT